MSGAARKNAGQPPSEVVRFLCPARTVSCYPAGARGRRSMVERKLPIPSRDRTGARSGTGDVSRRPPAIAVSEFPAIRDFIRELKKSLRAGSARMPVPTGFPAIPPPRMRTITGNIREFSIRIRPVRAPCRWRLQNGRAESAPRAQSFVSSRCQRTVGTSLPHPSRVCEGGRLGNCEDLRPRMGNERHFSSTGPAPVLRSVERAMEMHRFSRRDSLANPLPQRAHSPARRGRFRAIQPGCAGVVQW